MIVILILIILGCFGSIAAALALLLGLHHPLYLSIAAAFGIALPLVALIAYNAFTNAVANAAANANPNADAR